MSLFYCIFVTFSLMFVLTGFVALYPNTLVLPMKFYIVVLPFDGLSVNWALNYAYQFVDNLCSLVFFLGYYCLTLIFMNHSCWIVDAAISSAAKLGESLLQKEDNKKDVQRDLKIIIDQSMDIILWMNEARKILRFSFLFEFSLLSSILCMNIFTFISNPFESGFAMFLTVVAMSQLSVYCWMGSRVNTRIFLFSTAIYNIRWDKMEASLQKDLQMVLMMSQNIKGFDGVFKSVDLGSFQNVNEDKHILSFTTPTNCGIVIIFLSTGTGSDVHTDNLVENN